VGAVPPRRGGTPAPRPNPREYGYGLSERGAKRRASRTMGFALTQYILEYRELFGRMVLSLEGENAIASVIGM